MLTALVSPNYFLKDIDKTDQNRKIIVSRNKL
ncbi:hypothetical protein PEPS_35220 (plasmid) [Persicobacter psychrovividus]|uniref:Uncharacterized protein n=1 Tax=Persicobacter psychrovividus TaxID=387638 RepID=A0ABM7VJS2_9BACT|nr:hypothetical protein PEPS_35220 [Persicobacter psychrovividus]